MIDRELLINVDIRLIVHIWKFFYFMVGFPNEKKNMYEISFIK